MLLERSIVVSCETIRRWSLKFGSADAGSLRRKAARPADILQLDEVRIVIRGEPHWLWRVVDQNGYILDEILQTHRNTKAANRLLARHLKRQGLRPSRMITGKLKSYGAARRNMRKVRSPGGCQRFVSALSAIRNLFVPSASITTALSRHLYRVQAIAQWNGATVLSA